MCCIETYLLDLALVLDYVFQLAFSMCCIAEHLLYLAFVLNFVLIENVNVLHCKTPPILGACLELLLSFAIANVLCCKTPLTFGACVELRH